MTNERTIAYTLDNVHTAASNRLVELVSEISGVLYERESQAGNYEVEALESLASAVEELEDRFCA